MSENEQPLSIEIDRNSMRELLKSQLATVANKAIQDALRHGGLDKQIETATYDALKERVLGRNTFQENLTNAYDQALWGAMNEAVRESGLQALATEIINEHIKTPEFVASVKECAIQTVAKTTFHIKMDNIDEG